MPISDWIAEKIIPNKLFKENDKKEKDRWEEMRRLFKDYP